MVSRDGTMLSDVLFFFFGLIFTSLAFNHRLSKGASNRLDTTGVEAFKSFGRLGFFGFLNERKSSRSLTLLAFGSSYQILNRRAAVFICWLRAQQAFGLMRRASRSLYFFISLIFCSNYFHDPTRTPLSPEEVILIPVIIVSHRPPESSLESRSN